MIDTCRHLFHVLRHTPEWRGWIDVNPRCRTRHSPLGMSAARLGAGLRSFNLDRRKICDVGVVLRDGPPAFENKSCGYRCSQQNPNTHSLRPTPAFLAFAGPEPRILKRRLGVHTHKTSRKVRENSRPPSRRM